MSISERELIIEEFTSHSEKLEKQIEHVNTRQHELTGLISTIQSASNNIEILLTKEKDAKQKSKYYQIISRNTSLLTELYSTYQQFENVKHKYFQDIGKMVKDKHRLVEIELKSLEYKLEILQSDDVVNMMSEMKKLLNEYSGPRSKQLEKKTSLNEPEYSMD